MPAKLPPVEKIYEAWSAISSNRVEIAWDGENGSAEIASSNSAKVYHVKWTGNVFYSSDSATCWQGYAGYPVIAALMLIGKIPFCEDCARIFRDVNWNEANARAGRDYGLALREVMDKLGLAEPERERLREEAQIAFAALADADITLKRLVKPRKKRP